jgi:hypothetical protein
MEKKIYLTGNNGGDFIEITQDTDQEKIDVCNISVGCSCVKILDAQLPIEMITQIIQQVILFKNNGMSRKCSDTLQDIGKEVMNYNKSFVEERISKIIDYKHEMRYFTQKERKVYKDSLKRMFKPTGDKLDL